MKMKHGLTPKAAAVAVVLDYLASIHHSQSMTAAEDAYTTTEAQRVTLRRELAKLHNRLQRSAPSLGDNPLNEEA